MRNISKIGGFGAIIFLLGISEPTFAFAHEKLKELGERLQKQLPANSAPANKPEQINNSDRNSITVAADGSPGLCTQPEFGFSIAKLELFSVANPTELVNQYFNVNETTADGELKRLVHQNFNQLIGSSLAEAFLDGGILAGPARMRGLMFAREPSLKNLAQVIAAAEQTGKSSGFGKSSDLQIKESKLVLAIVAIQLEPILRRWDMIPELLKEARGEASFKALNLEGVISPTAYALSARYALFVEQNMEKFDNFLTTARRNQSSDFSGTGDLAFSKTMGPRMANATYNWAADNNLNNGKYAQQRAQGEQVLADMNKNSKQFNYPGWDDALRRHQADNEQLKNMLRELFGGAKDASQLESVTAAAEEQIVKMREFGGAVNEEMIDYVTLLSTATPESNMDSEKMARTRNLQKKMEDQAYLLMRPIMAATLSMEIDFRDLKRRSDAVMQNIVGLCFVQPAAEQIFEAANLPEPAEEDIKADDDFLRG